MKILVRPVIAAWCVLGLLGAGCSSEQATSDPTRAETNEGPASLLSTAACSTVMPGELVTDVLGDETVECGYVEVPASYDAPDGPHIQLAVYRVPSTSSDPADDPVVYLEGGPGGAGVGTVSDFSTGGASYLRDRSDVYVIDQRGTGYSIPALYCPEATSAPDLSTGHQACHDRFAAEGVDPAHYNSANNAADIDRVRQALGHDQWNVYGLSYGTRLALTIMRDQPAGIRAVVLDSVFPPQVNGLSEAPYTAYYTIEAIAANCDADADCVDAFGDLQALVEDGVARLAANPIGDLTADAYIDLLGTQIANPMVPELITIIATGTDDDIEAFMNAVAEDEGDDEEIPPLDQLPPVMYPLLADTADGMGLSVICAEEAPYLDRTAGPDLSDNFGPETQAVIDNVPSFYDDDLCSIWNAPPAGDVETQPVTSELPTLIVAGTADAATPPGWSRLSGDTLANSTYLEMPGFDHGLLGTNDCLNEITLAFLDDPESDPDVTCIANIPPVTYDTP